MDSISATMPHPKCMSKEPSELKHFEWFRLIVVVFGISVTQLILYGNSILGDRVLLPLDILARNDVLYNRPLHGQDVHVKNDQLSDLVFQWEPARQLAIKNIEKGEMPMWTPYQYIGCPVTWPKFSPFMLLECTTRSPRIIAWTQLISAIIAGLGMYMYCRWALGLRYWPCFISAWCFPISSFFVFWQGYPTCAPVVWLPWELLFVNRVISQRGLGSLVGLSLITGLILVSGALDVGCQVLLVSILYAAWHLPYADRKCKPGSLQKVVMLIALGWIIGFALAAPYTLPLLKYSRTGARMLHRSQGSEERPPEGLTALLPLFMPDIYGSDQNCSYRYGKQAQIESSATGYTGLLALLFAAPLAWFNRNHRRGVIFLFLLILLSISWCLDIPGFVQILRLPGLNMMSHNRLVFATSVSVCILLAIGIDALLQKDIQPHWCFWLPIGALLILVELSIYRMLVMPAPVKNQIRFRLENSNHPEWFPESNAGELEKWFFVRFAMLGLLSIIGIIAWMNLWSGRIWSTRRTLSFSLIFIVDLLWNANSRSTQSDPELYYKTVPALTQLSTYSDGRMIACRCLPASLTEMYSLHDVRGYDAIDPSRYMDVIELARNPNSVSPKYALTQDFIPFYNLIAPNRIRLSPILDMLNVKYVLFGGSPPQGIAPLLQDSNHWVVYNDKVLPRVFIPHQTRVAVDSRDELAKLACPDFDASATSYIEHHLDLPVFCDGRGFVEEELPTKISIKLDMSTKGLVVLSDLWDEGWKATLNGQQVPIHRVNYTLRGIVAMQGKSRLEFYYQPASYKIGIVLATIAMVAVFFMCCRIKFSFRRESC